MELEDEKLFEKRREVAEALRTETKQAMRYDHFVHMQSKDAVCPIRRNNLKKIHELILDGLPGTCPFPEPGTSLGALLRSSTTELIQWYSKIMKKIYIILALFAIVIISGITSCRKKAEVPADAATYDPGFPAGCTRVSILQLKNILGSGGLPVQITDNIAVEAYITADDRSGNFYKNIMIQDSTSGIALLLEKSGLYNDYPVGRKIYVKCKGLYLSTYGGFKQLGYSLDETKALVGVPAALFNTVVVKANYDPTLQPLNKLIKHVTLADLKSSVNNEAVMGCLIKMDSNVQFQSSQLGTTYAQAPSIASGTDRYLEQCGNAASIVLRTSGYCKFAANPWPKGRGALTAIYSRYNSTAQLLIRDENDVQFTDSIRCDGVVIQPGTPITIKTLRELYLGTGVKLGNLQIHGTIISSLKDSNISSGGYYMQDESGRGISRINFGV